MPEAGNPILNALVEAIFGRSAAAAEAPDPFGQVLSFPGVRQEGGIMGGGAAPFRATPPAQLPPEGQAMQARPHAPGQHQPAPTGTPGAPVPMEAQAMAGRPRPSARPSRIGITPNQPGEVVQMPERRPMELTGPAREAARKRGELSQPKDAREAREWYDQGLLSREDYHTQLDRFQGKGSGSQGYVFSKEELARAGKGPMTSGEAKIDAEIGRIQERGKLSQQMATDHNKMLQRRKVAEDFVKSRMRPREMDETVLLESRLQLAPPKIHEKGYVVEASPMGASIISNPVTGKSVVTIRGQEFQFPSRRAALDFLSYSGRQQ